MKMIGRLFKRKPAEPPRILDVKTLTQLMVERAYPPFKPIIPEPQATDYRREKIAAALYQHWAEEDLTFEYVCWDLLPDKATWYSRADAVMSADPKE